MYEVYVPATDPEGRLIEMAYHHIWDAKVRKLTQGLTVFQPAKGQWENEGVLYRDIMLPVRIACTPEQLEEIVNMTAAHYRQRAVIRNLVSTDVVISHFDQNFIRIRDEHR